MQVALAALVNVTIDDTDPTIFYTPPGSWHSSSVVCPVCLNPDTRDAFQNTYHDGTHVLSPPSPPLPPSPPSPSSPPVNDHSGAGGGGGDSGGGVNDDDGDGKSKTTAKQQEGPKPTMGPGALRRRSASDDPSAGVLVSAYFNFTGQAFLRLSGTYQLTAVSR